MVPENWMLRENNIPCGKIVWDDLFLLRNMREIEANSLINFVLFLITNVYQ